MSFLKYRLGFQNFEKNLYSKIEKIFMKLFSKNPGQDPDLKNPDLIRKDWSG